ncbi:MAG: cytochrome c3 family protein [Nitrospirae bacterium]|nr:cytochrome c3 family protein [Nitrospirota bacterium]
MWKLLLFAFIFVTTFISGYMINTVWFSDNHPAQPIAFSHRIHAGDNGIPCLDCHIYAERSAVAGVPSVQKCIGCHKIIKREAPEVVKLNGYWERQEPIPWIKVHNLPDFVTFPHKRHIRGGVQCNLCHGNIPEMDVVTRVSSLKMGWCIGCHTSYNVKNGRDCWTCHK